MEQRSKESFELTSELTHELTLALAAAPVPITY